jgi:hypothetical protein
MTMASTVKVIKLKSEKLGRGFRQGILNKLPETKINLNKL